MERICPVIEKEKVSAEFNDSGSEFSITLIPAFGDDGKKSKPTINEAEIIGMNEFTISSDEFYYNRKLMKQGDLALFHDDSAGNNAAKLVKGGDLEIATIDDDASKYSKQGVDLVYDNGQE